MMEMNELETRFGPPDLDHWECPDDKLYYVYENDVVRAHYEELLGLEKGTILSTFIINKNHYKDRMDDVVKHINYFLNFYDNEQELFMSTLSIKYTIDQKPGLSQKAFKKMILDRIITPSFITKIKQMARDLYTININTDKEGKFKTTPKITNDQARMLVSLSFAFRMILPLCVHYSNTNDTFSGKKDYIECFDKIYMEIVQRFEKDDEHVFNALCRFVKYRVDRSYSADKGLWRQKKQLYGITKELYLEELIHEVILVKSLHKLSYNRSCVSFVDGIIFSYNLNFKHENFKFKPFEIDAEESSSDSDDYLSHAEALEMSIYRIDESNAMINDINSKMVMKSIEERFNVPISADEMAFYMEHVKINSVIQFLLHSFYSPRFHNSYAIYTLNLEDTIRLLVYMKKYLQLKGMVILPQICTANVLGKFKDNSIKNSKFIEKLESSSVYNKIISTKFKYVKYLNNKEDPIIKKLSTIINSTFTFVDADPEINGIEYNDVNVDIIIDEFLGFLSII